MKIVIDGRPTWVNYHHLYCFFTIVTEGGLSKASKTLGIGQSALSIQMRQLEQHLGFPLFERSARKLVPNERGKIVLSYAKEIFRLGNEMVEALHDRPTASRIHLQIGALDTIPKHLTVQIVESALREQDCTVSVVEGKARELLQSLIEHRIDLLVANGHPQAEPGQLYTKRIARLPLWVVGGKSFLRLKKNFPASLAGQRFIVPTGESRARHEFEACCKRVGITPDYIAETQDVMVQKLLALKQLGLTVAPEFAVREYLDKKELFLIGQLSGAYEELFLISATRKIENPVGAFLMKRFQID